MVKLSMITYAAHYEHVPTYVTMTMFIGTGFLSHVYIVGNTLTRVSASARPNNGQFVVDGLVGRWAITS